MLFIPTSGLGGKAGWLHIPDSTHCWPLSILILPTLIPLSQPRLQPPSHPLHHSGQYDMTQPRQWWGYINQCGDDKGGGTSSTLTLQWGGSDRGRVGSLFIIPTYPDLHTHAPHPSHSTGWRKSLSTPLASPYKCHFLKIPPTSFKNAPLPLLHSS